MTADHTHEKRVDQLDGSRLAGLNCTCAAGASSCFRHTHGRVVVTSATMRRLTGDTSGGTNLVQVAAAARKLGIVLSVHQGVALTWFYGQLRARRGAIVQGASSATRGTRYQASPTFGGNHAWYVSRGRGWRLVNRAWWPAELLVYDPLADGRRRGIATSPFWISRYLFELFIRRLSLGSRLLGGGKIYAALTRATWPHFHPRHGGVGITPKMLTLKAGHNIRSGPSRSYAVKAKSVTGTKFHAFQKAKGQTLNGSSTWYGDHDGVRWVHSSALK